MSFDNASDKPTGQRATIGASVSIKGEISGDEDILIEGGVEGTINLKQNAVTVAKTGKVKANITGVTIHVEGEVIGDLTGVEQIIVHKSGRVQGNISSPRISIEDGARVRGQLNTDTDGEEPRPALSSRVEGTSTTASNTSTNGTGKSASGKTTDLTRPPSMQ